MSIKQSLQVSNWISSQGSVEDLGAWGAIESKNNLVKTHSGDGQWQDSWPGRTIRTVVVCIGAAPINSCV